MLKNQIVHQEIATASSIPFKDTIGQKDKRKSSAFMSFGKVTFYL